MQLRPYQRTIIDAARAEIARGHRRLVLQMPTGAGKTAVACELVRRSASLARRVLYTVPRVEILGQTARKLDDNGLPHFALTAGRRLALDGQQTLLAMSHTLDRRIRDWSPDWSPDLIIVDEAHANIEQAARLVAAFPRAAIVGLTATPTRLGDARLSEVYQSIVQGPGVPELQRGGYLVPCSVYGAPTPDLHAVRTLAGDYDPHGLQAAYRQTRLVGSAPEAWMRLARGRRTLLFAPGRDVSRDLVEAFVARGIRAEHVDGETRQDCEDCEDWRPGQTVPRCECRTGALARLRAGRIDVLSNVGLFVEGLDAVEVDCIQLFTATKSPARYLQEVGRGLRPSPHTGKRDLLVIDHGGNAWEHDLPDAERDWQLGGVAVHRKTGSGPAPLSTCKRCMAIHPPAPACPRCGAVPEASRKPPAQVSGELVRLDAGAVKARRGAKAAAERVLRETSQKTAARPCPEWAMQARWLWDRCERERVTNGYVLPGRGRVGYTENRVRRWLESKGAA